MKYFNTTAVFINEKHITFALNLILKNQLSYEKIRKIDKNMFEILVKNKELNKLCDILKNNDIDFKVSQSISKKIFISMKRRLGVLLGVLLLVSVIYLSSNLVWRIDIEGNTTLSDEYIIDVLEKSNFKIGSFIPSIDYDELQNKILIDCSDISWISLNVKGNVAKIQVKETSKENPIEKNTYTNIVASDSGQIIEIKVIDGQKIVNKLDVVKKGDLLISGVINSQSLGVKYADASGEVLATVNKVINIEVPYAKMCKKYTGKTYSKYKVKIFSKVINFSLNNNNYDSFCDKIEKEKQFELFNRYKLPFSLFITKYYEYDYEKTVYDLEETVDMGMAQLRQSLDNELKGAELISKSVKTYSNENGIYLYCNIYLTKNIAKEVEILKE